MNKLTICYIPYFSPNTINSTYNYIINGTYSTAFFVLTAMFVLAGIGFIMLHYLSDLRAEFSEYKAKTGIEKVIYENEIPEL